LHDFFVQPLRGYLKAGTIPDGNRSCVVGSPWLSDQADTWSYFVMCVKFTWFSREPKEG